MKGYIHRGGRLSVGMDSVLTTVAVWGLRACKNMSLSLIHEIPTAGPGLGTVL